MTISKKNFISITNIFEILVCVFYVWYFLPICNAALSAGIYKIAFFCCFAVGMVGLLVINGFSINKVVIIVLTYFLLFSLLFILKVDDADAHIRVSFTFWGTALLFFGALKDEGRIRIGKFLLAMYVITCITSSIGVILDNNAARTISHVAADDSLQMAYKLKNIANIYLFQSMILFVPILVCVPKTRKAKFFSVVLLVALLIVLLNASFTIALLIYLLALILSLIFKQKRVANRVILLSVFSILILLLLANGYNVMTFLGELIPNERISERMFELRDFIYLGDIESDAGLRWELYTASLKTFFDNWFGVGAHYSYITFENGIGYHSQLLDDLARYGVFAIIFYCVFFSGYHKYLKNQWKHLGHEQIATVILIIYFILLIFNLGFRSAEESVTVLFLMPAIPLMMRSWLEKKKNIDIERQKT